MYKIYFLEKTEVKINTDTIDKDRNILLAASRLSGAWQLAKHAHVPLARLKSVMSDDYEMVLEYVFCFNEDAMTKAMNEGPLDVNIASDTVSYRISKDLEMKPAGSELTFSLVTGDQLRVVADDASDDAKPRPQWKRPTGA